MAAGRRRGNSVEQAERGGEQGVPPRRAHVCQTRGPCGTGAGLRSRNGTRRPGGASKIRFPHSPQGAGRASWQANHADGLLLTCCSNSGHCPHEDARIDIPASAGRGWGGARTGERGKIAVSGHGTGHGDEKVRSCGRHLWSVNVANVPPTPSATAPDGFKKVDKFFCGICRDGSAGVRGLSRSEAVYDSWAHLVPPRRPRPRVWPAVLIL